MALVVFTENHRLVVQYEILDERYAPIGVNIHIFHFMFSLYTSPGLPVLLQEIGRLNMIHILCIVTGVLGVLLELGAESRHVLPTITEGENETLQEELALVDGISVAELREPVLRRLAALGLGLFQELGHVTKLAPRRLIRWECASMAS